MATYIYRCVGCKRTKEIRREMGKQPDTIPCDNCDCIMIREYTPLQFYFKATGRTRSK